jgi:homopolymeric O-antigen transport system permease protein
MPLRAARVEDENFSAVAGDAAPSNTGRTAVASQARLALLDILDGARRWELWGLLGWQDIRQRYRRSTLGPFWLTISMGAMVGGIGLLYAGIFHQKVADYLPSMALGVIIWGLLAGLVNENCSAFIEAEAIIKQVKLPLSVHIYRVVWRNLIIFAHNFVIFIIVAVIFKIWPGWAGLFALPALALVCVNGVWIGILLGLVSARFRDVPQIVASVMQIAFFLTPIIWKPASLPGHGWILKLNPFLYFLDLLRAPLLGQLPAVSTWLAALAVTLCGWALALFMYRIYRRRIAYWM